MIGTAIAPNATGAVLATSARIGRPHRREAQRDEHDRRDRDRRAEARERLQQGAEAERDEDRLGALVGRDAPKLRRSTSKWPVATVMLKIHNALTTIHMIGNRP